MSHDDETQPKAKPGILQTWLLRGNYLLVPLYFILTAALVPYGYRAVLELWHLLNSFLEVNESELIISVLTLCDIVMIANLIAMIAIGSYHVFIRKINLPDSEKPAWLQHITSGTLKVKMATSLVGISSIHLLKDFINSDATSWQLIAKHMAIHLVFLVSTIALVTADKGHADKH